jgi:hypothetical protein
MLRTLSSLRVTGLLTGLEPDPLPDLAATLLPGTLAATRTGRPPANDDELTNNESDPRRPPVLLAARKPGASCRCRW